MALVNNAKNPMLDHLASLAVFASLHTGDPSTTGANEVTGGSPAYARKAITWNAASGGALDNNANPVFDVPSGTTVTYVGFRMFLPGCPGDTRSQPRRTGRGSNPPS